MKNLKFFEHRFPMFVWLGSSSCSSGGGGGQPDPAGGQGGAGVRQGGEGQVGGALPQSLNRTFHSNHSIARFGECHIIC